VKKGAEGEGKKEKDSIAGGEGIKKGKESTSHGGEGGKQAGSKGN